MKFYIFYEKDMLLKIQFLYCKIMHTIYSRNCCIKPSRVTVRACIYICRRIGRKVSFKLTQATYETSVNNPSAAVIRARKAAAMSKGSLQGGIKEWPSELASSRQSHSALCARALVFTVRARARGKSSSLLLCCQRPHIHIRSAPLFLTLTKARVRPRL